MKEFRFGISLSEKGMEPFGSDELNRLIEEGWVVTSISPSQAFLRENPDKHTEESESVTFAGYEMCAVLEHGEFTKLFNKAGSLSKNLIRLDKTESTRTGFFERGKLKQAIELYEEALKIDPLHTGSLIFKAKCHETLNQNSEALQSLERAFEIEPFNVIICVEIGAALTKKRLFDRAIEILEQGAQYHPEDPRVLSNLGLSYLFAGLANRAVIIYEKLVEVEPEYSLNPRFLSYAKRVASGDVGTPQTEDDISGNL